MPLFEVRKLPAQGSSANECEVLQMPWNTNANEFAAAVAEFEKRLPGFWWSVGQCSVGAHASCGVTEPAISATCWTTYSPAIRRVTTSMSTR